CMDAPLAARSKFEVFYRIGDIGLLAVDANFLEDRVEELACGTDEGLSGEILAITGLLADEDDARVLRPFAEHCLRRILVEVAAGAGLRLLPQCFEGDVPAVDCRHV